METVTYVRLIGFVLAGIGAGYLGSMVIRRCAMMRVVANRRAMAAIGGMVGLGLMIGLGLTAERDAAPLPSVSTQTQLDETLAGAVDKPVAAVFYAQWCPPSRRLLPELRRVRRDWEGRATAVKIDVDEAMDLRELFGIRSVPTIVYFRNGAETGRTIGMVGRAAVEQRLGRLALAGEARARR